MFKLGNIVNIIMILREFKVKVILLLVYSLFYWFIYLLYEIGYKMKLGI